MDITPQLSASAQRITAYGGGGFRINDVAFEIPVLVLPEEVLPWAPPVGVSAEAIRSVIGQLQGRGLEIVLFGTGLRGDFLPPVLRQQLRDAVAAGVEVMDTGAACRTYNVLLAEGRKVAAALIPV